MKQLSLAWWVTKRILGVLFGICWFTVMGGILWGAFQLVGWWSVILWPAALYGIMPGIAVMMLPGPKPVGLLSDTEVLKRLKRHFKEAQRLWSRPSSAVPNWDSVVAPVVRPLYTRSLAEAESTIRAELQRGGCYWRDQDWQMVRIALLDCILRHQLVAIRMAHEGNYAMGRLYLAGPYAPDFWHDWYRMDPQAPHEVVMDRIERYAKARRR